MNDDFPSFRAEGLPDLPDAPLESRLTLATAVGCLGIVCVLLAIALLFLPIEAINAPSWLKLLVPLAAFSLLLLGFWIMLVHPPDHPIRSTDPRHPLTQSGVHPLVERPADATNRAMVVMGWSLAMAGLGGYLIASADTVRDGLMLGAIDSGAAGLGLFLLGGLVAVRRLPIPALRWVRVPIQSHRLRQGAPLALAGVALMAWAFYILAYLGSALGFLGFLALIAGCIALAALSRRTPRASTRRIPTHMPPIERQ